MSSKPSKGVSEAEEVREVLRAVSEFLEGLRNPFKEFIDMIMTTMDGKRVGEEVASFYKSLTEKGVPEDLAKEMTKDFLKRRLEAAPSIGGLVKAIENAIKGKEAFVMIKPSKGSDVDRALRSLERLKERRPRDREKIEEAINLLKSLKEEEGE